MDNSKQSVSNTAGQQERTEPLPPALQTVLEYLSGEDLAEVQVHYNSARPKKVQAMAYAFGSKIYLSQQAEQHLPHESWHVVQQKQGRVAPNADIGGEELNDDPELEKEALIMGNLVAAMALAMQEGYITL